MNPKTDSTPAAVAAAQGVMSVRKPFFSLFVATAGGLGYIPKAPGTFGSFAGVALAYVLSHSQRVIFDVAYLLNGRTANGFGLDRPIFLGKYAADPDVVISAFVFLAVALMGVWTAGRVEKYSRVKDPQFVVIDEVSGQHLALLLGGMLPLVGWFTPGARQPWSTVLFPRHPNWIILLLGLILFRVFDIWKPFPARQAESLPGGWGIMADDWMAGIYAGIFLWLARGVGL